jgi:hypothetical protein
MSCPGARLTGPKRKFSDFSEEFFRVRQNGRRGKATDHPRRDRMTKMPLPLDYPSPSLQPAGKWRLLIWLLPVWCAVVVATPSFSRFRDDPFWIAALGLPVAAGAWSATKRARGLVLYCIIVELVLLALSAFLPSLNRSGD